MPRMRGEQLPPDVVVAPRFPVPVVKWGDCECGRGRRAVAQKGCAYCESVHAEMLRWQYVAQLPKHLQRLKEAEEKFEG